MVDPYRGSPKLFTGPGVGGELKKLLQVRPISAWSVADPCGGGGPEGLGRPFKWPIDDV